MEFKRIPFIAVQRKFNLTDRQMYYIRDRIRKYHKEDEWFIFEYNAIGELIENFVGDLVGGTYSNGSDERDYADQWFERCWFGMFPEPTLLNHLLNLGYEPEHYLDMLENVETIKSDIEITKQNIAEPSDEWKDIVYHKYNDDRTSYECVPCYNSVDEYIASEKEDLESYKADLEEALEELKDMRADWKPEKEPNMDEEIELIKKWVKEREDFINE